MTHHSELLMHNGQILAAFDVDGTLIHQVGEREDTPRYDVINLFQILQRLGFTMIIWSGSGVDYATRWTERLGLKAAVVEKGSLVPTIAFDDCEVNLGKINVKV